MNRLDAGEERGFTLIEIMIVIAIIAVLAAILIPNLIRARMQSQFAACESNLKNTAIALELYFTDYNDDYPPGPMLTLLTPTYMQSIPTCPLEPTVQYTYAVSSNPAAYLLSQTHDLHKGAEGTSALPSNGAGTCPAYPCYLSDGGLFNGK